MNVAMYDVTKTNAQPGGARELWLSCPKPNPQARLRLFCFPYAGGSALIYRAWPNLLPADIEVQLLQLPGRGKRLREAPYTDLLKMVADIAPVIRPLLDKPFAFFGHSMGALIGFELTHLLRAEHHLQPAHLFVSGRSAPQLPDTDPPTYELPEEEFVQELRRLGGTPHEVLEHPELMHLMIPLLRADFSVCQTYAFTERPPLSCPLTAFGGLQDHEVPRENLEAWNELTTAACKVRMLPGDHFFLRTSQQQLLQTIAQELYQLTRSAIHS